MSWPDTRLLELFGVDLPILLAPMANFAGLDMALAVAEAGGLAALPCAALNAEQIKEAVAKFRAQSSKPLNFNFFCHATPEQNVKKERAWLSRIAAYFEELGVSPPSPPLSAGHAPFGEAACGAIEDLKPEIVSFHFGLPPGHLLARVKATGCTLLSTATTLREAEFLEAHGVDAIIAQGAEAGGHRGMFIETDLDPGRHLCAGAGHKRGCRAAGDRRGRNCRRPRYRGFVRTRRLGRPDRHRLSCLSGIHDLAAASQGARRSGA